MSTKWVDYVEEPMKYQALSPNFSLLVGEGGGSGGGGVGVGVVGWVVVGWVVVGVQSGGGVLGGVIRLSF